MKLDHITFTRYVAALSVVFFHFGQNIFPANISWLNPIITAGPIAVCYFFALSGFIMAIAYYKPSNDGQHHKILDKKKYWLARIARIYPVYLLALLLVIAANLKGEGKDPITVLLSLSMLQAWVPGYALTLNSPGWSLSVEAFFYLAFPFLLPLLYQKQKAKLLLIASLLLWLLTQIVQTKLHNSPIYQPFSPLHEFIYYFPLMHLSVFLLGLITGAYFCEGRLKSLGKPFWNGALLIVVSLLIGVSLIAEAHLENQLGFLIDYNNGLIAPLFILFIVLLALNQGWVMRLFSLPILVLLGEASYSLYILQRPIYGIYTRTLGQWLPLGDVTHFYLFVLILTGIALLSFKYLETPLRAFINSMYGTPAKKSH